MGRPILSCIKPCHLLIYQSQFTSNLDVPLQQEVSVFSTASNLDNGQNSVGFSQLFELSYSIMDYIKPT